MGLPGVGKDLPPVVASCAGAAATGMIGAVVFGGIATGAALIAAVVLPAIAAGAALLTMIYDMCAWKFDKHHSALPSKELVLDLIAVVAFVAAVIFIATGIGVPFAFAAAATGFLAFGIRCSIAYQEGRPIANAKAATFQDD